MMMPTNMLKVVLRVLVPLYVHGLSCLCSFVDDSNRHAWQPPLDRVRRRHQARRPLPALLASLPWRKHQAVLERLELQAATPLAAPRIHTFPPFLMNYLHCFARLISSIRWHVNTRRRCRSLQHLQSVARARFPLCRLRHAHPNTCRPLGHHLRAHPLLLLSPRSVSRRLLRTSIKPQQRG